MPKDKVLGSVSSTGSFAMWSGKTQRDRIVIETKAQMRSSLSFSHMNELSFSGNINALSTIPETQRDLCMLLQGREQEEKQKTKTMTLRTLKQINKKTQVIYKCVQILGVTTNHKLYKLDMNPRKCAHVCLDQGTTWGVVCSSHLPSYFMRWVPSLAWNSPNRWGWLDSISQGSACLCLPSA